MYMNGGTFAEGNTLGERRKNLGYVNGWQQHLCVFPKLGIGRCRAFKQPMRSLRLH